MNTSMIFFYILPMVCVVIGASGIRISMRIEIHWLILSCKCNLNTMEPGTRTSKGCVFGAWGACCGGFLGCVLGAWGACWVLGVCMVLGVFVYCWALLRIHTAWLQAT